LVAAFILLAGCSDYSWFGGNAKPPLPGERISVLMHEQELKPDPNLEAEKILLPPPSPTADWPQAGGYPNHAMHHLQVGGQLRQVWSVNAGNGANSEELLIASPIIAEGRVYVMDVDSRVSTFDANSGALLWRVGLTPDTEDDGHIGGGLGYAGKMIFAATGFAQVIALNAETGAQVWRQKVSAPLHVAPTIRGGRVFVVTIDNKLIALDMRDGSILWTHEGLAEVANVLGGASPAVDNGIVVTAYSSGELVALKVDDGRVLWTESLSATRRRTGESSTLSHIRGRPIIDRDRVYALSHGGLMASFDLKSGQRIWDKDLGGLESPWIAGDFLFVITKESELAALSRENGKIYWVLKLPKYSNPDDREGVINWTGPLLTSDRLIVAGSHGIAMSISPYTGQILGTEKMPAGVSVSPAVANQTVYFLSDSAELIAYR